MYFSIIPLLRFSLTTAKSCRQLHFSEGYESTWKVFTVRPHPFKYKATVRAEVVLWLTTDKRSARQGAKRFRERKSVALLVCIVFYVLLIRPYVLNYKAICIKLLIEFEHQFSKISGDVKAVSCCVSDTAASPVMDTMC